MRGSLFLIEPFVLHITTNSDEAVCSRNVLNFRRDTLAELLSDKEIDMLSLKLRSCIMQLGERDIAVMEEHFCQIEEKWLRFRRGGEKRCEKLAYIVYTSEISGNISVTFSGSIYHSKSKAARMYIVPGEDPSCMSKTNSDENGSQATAAGADTDTVLTAELDAGTTYYISCGDSLACTTKDASDAQLEPNRQFDNKEGDGQYATMTAELTAGMHYYIWAYYYNRDEANFAISEISYDTNQE